LEGVRGNGGGGEGKIRLSGGLTASLGRPDRVDGEEEGRGRKNNRKSKTVRKKKGGRNLSSNPEVWGGPGDNFWGKSKESEGSRGKTDQIWVGGKGWGQIRPQKNV